VFDSVTLTDILIDFTCIMVRWELSLSPLGISRSAVVTTLIAVASALQPHANGGVHAASSSKYVAAADVPTRKYQNIYYITLGPLMLTTLILSWYTRPRITRESLPKGFQAFRYEFLIAWGTAVAADWLQGPYVYAVYAAYGFSDKEISQLFVAGFVSSMIFGTIVGSLADSRGRKRCAILYCVLYLAACLTKHINSFAFLFFGRVLAGIATSLLFTSFECWMIAEHRHRYGFGEDLLRYMFGMMYFVQYSVAIAAGAISQIAATATPLLPVPGFPNLFYGGALGAFDISMLPLLAAMLLIAILWDENYGLESSDSRNISMSLSNALSALKDWRIVFIGAIVSCFEGGMYSFVIDWTPTLSMGEDGASPPYGIIFSSFMMACMCGSSSFSLMHPKNPPEMVLMATLVIAASALFAVTGSIGMSSLCFIGFLIFEFCVGMYFPAMGVLKSKTVPEAMRASVYNICRVPLNMVVACIQLSSLQLSSSYGLCSGLIFGAFCCAASLNRNSHSDGMNSLGASATTTL
jgi:MFS family permease